jgi:hypothetical protein
MIEGRISEQEEKQNEYREFLKKNYEENQKFIDKAIFTFSSAAIPLLISFSEKLSLHNSLIFWLYFVSLGLFIIVITMQIIACRIAKEGCDLGYNDNNTEKALKLFKRADEIDFILIFVFVIAILITVLTITTDINIKNGERMNRNQQEEYQNSLTPPKSIRENNTQNVKKEVKTDSSKGGKNDGQKK